ncbi:hypothetical protein KJ953_03280 [Patescibacteria group bacterium]|nr:hypothetical protein [Patescibacteria group bacterium]MBU1256639.1 hypothetical protein [Patescibacteria group bacterium]MBU1457143.1 hypothetical protein [Patescibacteria group bacterium]
MSLLEQGRKALGREKQEAEIAKQQELAAEQARQEQVNKKFDTLVKPELTRIRSEFWREHVPSELFNLLEEARIEIQNREGVSLERICNFDHGDLNKPYLDKHRLIKLSEQNQLNSV